MNNATRPFAGFEWMLAVRYVRARRQERFVSVISIISLVGIALGVATLIVVLAVMSGFRAELTSRILGVNGHIRIESTSSGLQNYREDVAALQGMPGIIHVTPLIEGQVLASQNGVNFPVNVRGLTSEDLGALSRISSTLSPGTLQRFGEPDTVVVGERLARRLGLVTGRTITLVSPDPSGEGADVSVRTFVLAGTFSVGARQYDEDMIFMPFEQAQSYFDVGDVASAIEIMLADPETSLSLVPAIEKAVEPGARVLPWQVTNSTFFGALRVERNVMALILTLMILVAAMNLVSSFIMLVKDKAGDIAILRTMGATRATVMRVFFIAGAGIGVAGTLIGLTVGVLFCSNFAIVRPFLTNLFINPILNANEVSFVVIVALALSFFATLIPSWRAARLDPVEALRYE